MSYRDPIKHAQAQRRYHHKHKNEPKYRNMANKCVYRYQKKYKTHRKYKWRRSKDEFREAIIYYLLDRDGTNCFYCNQAIDIDNLNIGHKMAVALGGMNRMENFVLCHPKCNNDDAVKVTKQIMLNKYGY